MSNILSITDLCKDTAIKSILYNLNLNIDPGSITAVLGLDGDGKEKLFEILAGLDKPSSGSITYKDRKYSPTSVAAALKTGILYISEEANLAPDLTISESLTLGLSGRYTAAEKISALQKTGLQSLILNTLCSSLTPAQSRLLLLARAILSNAEIYLFNKLDLAFSQEERNIYFSVIRDLKSKGHTVLFIPGIFSDFQFADNFCIIRNGTIISAPESITNIRESVYSDDSGSIFPISETSRSNNIILESLGLKGREIKDVSLSIREKEVCGIFGLKGSGLQELISIFTGQSSSTGGVLSANKSNLQAKKMLPSKRLQAGISIFNGRLNPDLDYDTRTLRLRAIKENIIVLIDPATGLNFTERKKFYRLITEIKLQGKAIIMLTASIEELQGISDTIAIMHNGELSATRSTNNWTDEEIYKYVTSGKLEAFSIL